MAKKISVFLKNFKNYIVIVITTVLILLVLGLIVRNITKDKDNETNPTLIKSTVQEFEMPNTATEETDEKPLEPTPPQIEIPKIQ